MTKISIQVPGPDASSYHRVFAPIDALSKIIDVKILSRWGCFDADVAVFQRVVSQATVEVFHSLKIHGVRTVLDIDDNIFAIENHNPGFEAWNADTRKIFRQLLRLADVVTYSTPQLRGLVRDFNSNLVEISNGLDFEGHYNLDKLRKIRERSKKKDSRVVIGFSGSQSHSIDFQFLRGTFQALRKRFGEKIVFRFAGCAPDYLEKEFGDSFDRMVEVSPWVDIFEHTGNLAHMGLDIALAPLEKTEFNRCRSNLKWLEYTAAGAATVLTDFEPYLNVDKLDAVKLPNRASLWTEQISHLVESSSARKALQESSLSKLSFYSLNRAAEQYKEVIRDLSPRVAYSVPKKFCEKNRKIDIVVPIFNALADLQTCVDALSLADFSSLDVEILLIDDASTDSCLSLYLESLKLQNKFKIYRNESNLGFVGTCNAAASKLSRSDADLIFLNSDVTVFCNFAVQLNNAAYSDKSIGTVTACSDHGSLATLPPVFDIQELLAKKQFPLVLTPTVVGHCFYVKREVLLKYDLFLPEFGKGYGEENEFSMRIRKDYRSVLDPNCFVLHRNHSSFVIPVSQIEKVVALHPGYLFEVHNFFYSDPLKEVRRYLFSHSKDPRPRLLNIVHSYLVSGGTEKHVLELSRALAKDYLILTASPDPNMQSLQLYYDDQHLCSSMYLNSGYPITASQMPFADEAWNKILESFKPDLIHLHHNLNHPLGLLNKLTSLSSPLFVSIHDGYFVCPDWTLVDCPGVNACDGCFQKRFRTEESPTYQLLRRDAFRHGLSKAAAIVAPSRYIADKFREVYDFPVEVIPHGIDITANLSVKRTPGPIRFGFLGNFLPQKGAYLLLQAFKDFLEKNPRSKAELHVYGGHNLTQLNLLPDKVFFHGSYTRKEISGLLSQVDIGIIPSTMAEAYCYTLDEMLACSLPVLAANHGALPERIKEGVNGWTFQAGSRDSLTSAMSKLSSLFDLGLLLTCPQPEIRNTADMALSYSSLFKRFKKSLISY